MKITFNDSVLAISPANVCAGEINFISSNLILENKKVYAQRTFVDVDDLLDAYFKLKDKKERERLLKEPGAQTHLNDPDKLNEFIKKRDARIDSEGSTRDTAKTSIYENIAEKGIEESQLTGTPASKFAPYMEVKDTILSRLRPFMSEDDIANVFDQLENKIKLPYTEVISLLDSLIAQAKSSNLDVTKVINFFIDHYSEKRQYNVTKEIIKQAGEYQKLNPVIDIFSVLSDAIHGNQPNVNLGYLSNDPANMRTFNQLIMLSQSSLPEQSEELRRMFQESRDDLDNQQQKFNMKRALVDMMKTEEMNKSLVSKIKLFGKAFESLMTQPLYRALRDIFYDLTAAKEILNQASSVFLGDRSPETKPSTQFETTVRGEQPFPSIPTEFQPFKVASIDKKFIKVSQNSEKYVYAQGVFDVSKIGGLFQNLTTHVNNVLADTVAKIKEKFKELIGKPLETIINYASKFFGSISSVIEKIKKDFLSKNIACNDLNKYFEDFANLMDSTKTAKFNNIRIVVSQRSPQDQNIIPKTSDEDAKKFFDQLFGWVTSIGLVLVGSNFGISKLTNLTKIKDFDLSDLQLANFDIINAVGPAFLAIKNIFIELINNTGLCKNLRNAPTSNVFFDSNGKLTDKGKQTQVNAQETMIALGIAEQDAIALGKFAVEKTYLMDMLNQKEQNLKLAENQIVQIGGGSTESTVGDLPLDFQNKVRDFVNFCSEVENKFKAVLNIFRAAVTRVQSSLDSAQSTHLNGQFALYQKDLINVQAKKAEWSSQKNIASHLARKRFYLNKLKPLQTQLDTLRKLGIPIANAISGENGILQLSGKIRREEQAALDQLRKEQKELSDLLKNPDISSPTIKYPTDTGIVKLPEKPFDLETQFGFDIKQQGQSADLKNNNLGVKNV